jgi:hypothetical protein
MRIEHHQPRLVPPPIPEPQERPSTRGQEWVNRSRSYASRASSHGSFSVRRKLNAYNGPRRTRNQYVISAPTDFRHVENSMPRRTEVFRPLELSIYMPENQISPILPHFGSTDLSFESDDLTGLPYPPAALTHSRTESALSFRIPRKPLRTSSGASSEWTAQFKPRPDSLSTQELLAALEKELPKAPAPARLRAMTEPPAYERVKSALHEKFDLERQLKDIEEQIEERRSIYMSSRPTSRATSTRPTSVTSVYEDSKGTYLPFLSPYPALTRLRTNASTSTQTPALLCSPSVASVSRSTPQNGSFKDGPHPHPPKVFHRSIRRLYHAASIAIIFSREVPKARTRTKPPTTTTSPSGLASTPSSPPEEKIFLPGLKLALPRTQPQHFPRLRNQHAQTRDVSRGILPMR